MTETRTPSDPEQCADLAHGFIAALDAAGLDHIGSCTVLAMAVGIIAERQGVAPGDGMQRVAGALARAATMTHKVMRDAREEGRL